MLQPQVLIAEAAQGSQPDTFCVHMDGHMARRQLCTRMTGAVTNKATWTLGADSWFSTCTCGQGNHRIIHAGVDLNLECSPGL